MHGNLEPEEAVMGKGKWLGELSKALQELEMNVIRRPNPPKSSLPMVDFEPHHDAYEWDHADYQESVK